MEASAMFRAHTLADLIYLLPTLEQRFTSYSLKSQVTASTSFPLKPETSQRHQVCGNLWDVSSKRQDNSNRYNGKAEGGRVSLLCRSRLREQPTQSLV